MNSSDRRKWKRKKVYESKGQVKYVVPMKKLPGSVNQTNASLIDKMLVFDK